MNLWAVSVSEKNPAVVSVPVDRDLLITRAALATTISGTNQLSYSNEGQTFVLGTLRFEACEQFELDMCVSSSSNITFSLKGKGTVHLSGYYNALCVVTSESEDSDDYVSGVLDLSDSSDDADFMSVTKSPSESIDSDDDADKDPALPFVQEVAPTPPKNTKRQPKKPAAAAPPPAAPAQAAGGKRGAQKRSAENPTTPPPSKKPKPKEVPSLVVVPLKSRAYIVTESSRTTTRSLLTRRANTKNK